MRDKSLADNRKAYFAFCVKWIMPEADLFVNSFTTSRNAYKRTAHANLRQNTLDFSCESGVICFTDKPRTFGGSNHAEQRTKQRIRHSTRLIH